MLILSLFKVILRKIFTHKKYLQIKFDYICFSNPGL